ncbi:hypothetical protein RYX45_06560 [Alkalihalophilus pseudofirmus]|uniref:Uncharacterized protein n=1 Tax=Alkalihalophilus pseudofirmus TaxID=79885 RepID=A0AAJ2KZK0_ALKPS|nr:hypothetical protein [Alkalihalophilus pseudofirmus]MDV2884833.1 hypothetical protein [Alkalihalophilus pseudofirmus]
MSNRIYTATQISAAGFFILMLVKDFFPAVPVSMTVAALVVVFSILLSVVFRPKSKPVFQSAKQELLFIIVTSAGFFGLLALLPVFGGTSERGISVTSPILWGVFLISLFTAYNRYKKEKQQSTFPRGAHQNES